ncbi:MAG TPA: zinc-binding dehydrogenase [Luteitalea sp.]|nr:zinc-binding dehydrogenase [Luteitalea sp.]
MSSGLTVFAGINRAQLPPGSQVAVLGAGGLGHLAIQFLHKMGHAVTALSQSPSKQALIGRLGGRFVISEEVAQLTELRGTIDFMLSTLNVPFDLDAHLRLLKPHGQLCLVAAPNEPLALSGGLLNNSRRAIYGNYIGSRAETEAMLQFAAANGIEGVVEVAPLAAVNEAIHRVRTRAVEMCLVLKT